MLLQLLPENNQSQDDIAIGAGAGKMRSRCLALGCGAETQNAGFNISMGFQNPGQTQQNADIPLVPMQERFKMAVVLLLDKLQAEYRKVLISRKGRAGNTQGTQSIAIGLQAGATSTQGDRSISIGRNAGKTQGSDAIAIGNGAGETTQSDSL